MDDPESVSPHVEAITKKDVVFPNNIRDIKQLQKDIHSSPEKTSHSKVRQALMNFAKGIIAPIEPAPIDAKEYEILMQSQEAINEMNRIQAIADKKQRDAAMRTYTVDVHNGRYNPPKAA